MSREEFQARVGTKLRGKWSLDRLIGVGGMAAVYAATHKIGRTDAIKLLDPEVAVSEDLRARFEQEALAVNSIGHPGTVEIRDIDVTEDGTPFLVMELLEGQTLAERAAAGRCRDLDELLRLVDELLDVLVAAHAKGIIHRDIKPENLFVQRDGRLKVLDFGIARMRDGVVRTLAGTMLGTVAYMPPEQIKGEPVDRRADLFSVGATMFRLIAGRPVHEAEDEWKVGTKMLTEPAPPLGSVVSEVPERVGWIVDRALAFVRQRRYPSAATMRADVRAALNGDDPPYALARLEAGDDPHSTEAAPDSSRGERSADAPAKDRTDRRRSAATRSDAPPADPRSGKDTAPMRLGLERTRRGMPPGRAERPANDAVTGDDGQPSPAATVDQAPAKRSAGADRKDTPADGDAKLAPTRPQLPAFLDDSDRDDEPSAPVDPADPAEEREGRPRSVAPTDPQMPAFAVAAAEPATPAADDPAPASRPPNDGDDGDDGDDGRCRNVEADESRETGDDVVDRNDEPSSDDGNLADREPAAPIAPRRSRRLLILLALLVAALLAALWWWQSHRTPSTTPVPSASGPR